MRPKRNRAESLGWHEAQNKLYKMYMKYETSFNKKNCYTQYENKLPNIMRRHEKGYYKLLLDTNTNNLKNMWPAIRSVINNCKHSKSN